MGVPKVKLLTTHRANVFFHALALASGARTSVSYRENINTNAVNRLRQLSALCLCPERRHRSAHQQESSRARVSDGFILMLGKDWHVTASDGTVVDINGRAQQGNFRFSAGIIF